MKSMKLGVAVQRLWCRGLLVHVPARSRTCSTLCNHSPLSTETCEGGCVYCCTKSLYWGLYMKKNVVVVEKLLTRRAGDLRIDCVSAPVVGSAGVLAHSNTYERGCTKLCNLVFWA